jgi:hypothetical protein
LGILGLTLIYFYVNEDGLSYVARTKHHVNYHKELKKSLKGDMNAIKSFATLDYDGGVIYEHGENLIRILESVGDSTFIEVLDILTDKEKNKVSTYILAGADSDDKISRDEFEVKHQLVFNKLIEGCWEESGYNKIPPIFRDFFTARYIDKCDFKEKEITIDVKNYLQKLEEYRVFCLDRSRFDEYEDSLHNCKFFYNKSSASEEYALASSFYLYNYNSCLSEDIGYRTAILFAIFPEKFQVLDTYANSLERQRRDSLWNSVFDYIQGAIMNYDYDISEGKALKIVEDYYPFIFHFRRK